MAISSSCIKNNLKKYLLLIFFLFVMPLFLAAQNKPVKIIYTDDIDRFWIAYDSVKTTIDTGKQVSFIQKLYIDKGTEGLQAFIKARDYDAQLWVKLINKYPKFWASIRLNTLQIKNKLPQFDKSIIRLQKLYPEMKRSRMFFAIGGLNTGGTTTGDMVLIGTEIAAADKNTDATELSGWLKGVFSIGDTTRIVALNIHEYVHTQQKEGNPLLLAQCITEGSADFIAELATAQKNNSPYMVYGSEHEAELKEKFKAEMYSYSTYNWLYNGGKNADQADLGYYIGYDICKAYYKQAKNKKQAIKNIIKLDYGNEEALDRFLAVSKFYNGPINKKDLRAKYEALQPYVVSLTPDINGHTNVDTAITELTINFSAPMGKGVSINIGKGGRDHFPLTKVIGFTEDKKSFKIQMALQPGKTYDFAITGNGFRSSTGYPLKEYQVSFTTK